MPPPKVSSEKQVSEEAVVNKDRLKYQCTACEEYIKTSFQAYLHPLLQCLICRKCHTEYKTGDFAEDFEEGVDPEGIDNYCRWCVDGGDLFACSNQDKETDRCTHVFCDKCIARNVPDDPLLQLESQPEGFKWLCYVCNPAPLKELRKQAAEAILSLSQKDLQRKDTGTASSQGPVNSNQRGDKVVSSNGAASNKKDSEITSVSKSPATAAPSKKDDKVAPSSSKSNEKNLDEPGSERKKRRTEAASAPAPELEKRESSTRKEKDKKKDEETARDPESIRLPPLEKPKQPVSALRNLSRPSLLPSSRSHTIPPGTTSRNSTTPQSSSAAKPPPASSGNSISRPSLTTSAKVGFIPHGPSARQPAPDKLTSTTQASSNANTTVATASVTTTSTSAVTPTTTSGSLSTDAVAKSKTNSLNKAIENIDSGRSSVPPSAVSATGQLKLKAHSKGLKPNNDQVKHASTKVKLTEQDLDARLKNLCNVKNKCVQEIDIKLQSICEMFKAKDLTHKSIIKREIEDLKAPLQEFQTMLVNLESLYSSQS